MNSRLVRNVAVPRDWVRERLSVSLSVWDWQMADRWLNVQSSADKGYNEES